MKNFDYKKAKKIVNENMDNLTRATLGMYEDWFWTAESIFEDGAFTKDLPDNAIELQDKFIEARKNGLSMFLDEEDEDGLKKPNPEYSKFTQHQIAGLFGSSWATPVIRLYFKDGTEKVMLCHDDGDSTELAPVGLLGEISSIVQDGVPPISD